MEKDRLQYWDGKYKSNAAPWHKDDVNQFLVNNFSHILKVKNPVRVLVPLCGKTFDMKWYVCKNN